MIDFHTAHRTFQKEQFSLASVIIPEIIKSEDLNEIRSTDQKATDYPAKTILSEWST
jgi:hypothetical protein